LNEVEREIIDTPEFQRLFRLSQLGFVDLVFPCANHTRGIHSLGCNAVAKRLVESLNQNKLRLQEEKPEVYSTTPLISRSEEIVIALAALLHDVSHAPYSHDIEKKSHELYVPQKEDRAGAETRDPTRLDKLRMKSAYGPYEKHDDYLCNPVLYVLLMDPAESLIAQVLRKHSAVYWSLFKAESETASYPQLSRLTKAIRKYHWPEVGNEVLPSLIFHLLVFEKFEDSVRECEITMADGFGQDGFSSAKNIRWGLGPPSPLQRKHLHEAWYQPYRHDIVGDTLSADLIDYLHRDARRLGINRTIDSKLFTYHVLVPYPSPVLPQRSPAFTENLFVHDVDKEAEAQRAFFRCAIDLNDYKRNSIRTEPLNDLFRMLDVRHEIHEKAVFHRVVQSAIAMLSRTFLRLPRGEWPSLRHIYGLEEHLSPSLRGEDQFLADIISAVSASDAQAGTQSIPQKLAERRVYRPLLIIPGDRVFSLLFEGSTQPHDHKTRELLIRELAAIVDSEHFKSYFCFVSRCIEQLLEHSLETGDLDKRISAVLQDKELLSALCGAKPPKRVVFWTVPYKQLYKDPAVLIRVRETVARIDRIVRIPEIEASVAGRVAAGMAQLEAQYAAMWKFYAFASDGLFYTGALAKFAKLPCSLDKKAHGDHLKAAQIVVVRSLHAAWKYWEMKKSMEGGRKPVEQLTMPATPDDLLAMLREMQRFADTPLLHDHHRHEIGPIAADHYLHGEDQEGCRDIRYKYDPRADLAALNTALKNAGLPFQVEQLIKSLFESCGRPLSDFRREELSEIIGRLATSPELLPLAIRRDAARLESPFDIAVIRNIWLHADGETQWKSGVQTQG